MTQLAGTGRELLALLLLPALAAILTAGMIRLLLPLMKRYALARPNARSSHSEPTPQGGGVAVVSVTLLLSWLCAAHWGFATGNGATELIAVTAAAAVLALLGTVDDIRGLGAAPRLVLQSAAVILVVAALPEDWRVIPTLPWSIERTSIVIGMVWFVNLTNFMDGIDWITVAEVVPIAGAVAFLAIIGVVDALYGTVALALLGALIGFAPFNKPVARLFLGDVGSLPIGLLTAWLVLEVAHRGHLAAALLLPLYYLADATLTLFRRLARGEPVWQAHRTHFYQRATAGGYTVTGVVARIGATNLTLIVLAFISVAIPGPLTDAATLAAGAALVGSLLAVFARGRT